MSVDTTLDLAFNGQPFVVVPPSGVDTSTLDYAFLGVPFVAPVDQITVSPTVTELTTATDSVTSVVTRAVAVTETTTATDSISSAMTRPVFVTETTTASDSAVVSITHAEDAVAGALSGMDFAFDGQPFLHAGADESFGLDFAFAARPFIIAEVPFTGTIQPSIKIFSHPQML